jgi:hypothetical protein
MTFGEVVRFKGWEHVYLHGTSELIYLARIYDVGKSQLLIKERDRVYLRGGKNMGYKQASISWAFVELSTKEYKDRIAHYGYPDFDPEDILDPLGKELCVRDKKALQAEIKNDPGVAKELKEYVSKLKLV